MDTSLLKEIQKNFMYMQIKIVCQTNNVRVKKDILILVLFKLNLLQIIILVGIINDFSFLQY